MCLGGVTVASVGLWLISNDGKNCDDHSDTSVAMDDTATDEEDEDETTERWCSNIKIVFIQIIKSLEVNWCYFFSNSRNLLQFSYVFIIFEQVIGNFFSVECHLCAELHSVVGVDAKNMNIA